MKEQGPAFERASVGICAAHAPRWHKRWSCCTSFSIMSGDWKLTSVYGFGSFFGMTMALNREIVARSMLALLLPSLSRFFACDAEHRLAAHYSFPFSEMLLLGTKGTWRWKAPASAALGTLKTSESGGCRTLNPKPQTEHETRNPKA